MNTLTASLRSLAVVFSPCMMRNPSNDPIEILQNAKFETKFVALMFNVGGVRSHAPRN